MVRYLLLAGLFAGVVLGAGIIRDTADLASSYDYIIAGGGLSGLVVANRLSEDSNGKESRRLRHDEFHSEQNMPSGRIIFSPLTLLSSERPGD
jgi:hypothetical protein